MPLSDVVLDSFIITLRDLEVQGVPASGSNTFFETAQA